MWEGTILSILINLEIPDDGRKQDDWRLHKEISLLLNPSSVEIEHDCISTLIRIGDVCHKCGIDWITSMAFTRVIKVNYEEFRFYLIGIEVVAEMVISNLRKVGELVVVDIHRKAFLNLLLDVVIDDCI
ncbi:hypothetical protein IX335_001485 [Porphyromonas levii]|nr:hypothetical protein [Porphyromonas levii]